MYLLPLTFSQSIKLQALYFYTHCDLPVLLLKPMPFQGAALDCLVGVYPIWVGFAVWLSCCKLLSGISKFGVVDFLIEVFRVGVCNRQSMALLAHAACDREV